MSSSLTRFAMRIKQVRKQRDLSQQAVADKAGITREYLARLEAGKQDPSLSVVQRLAKALKVTVAEMVEVRRMTAIGKTFKWMLWPRHEYQSVATDEFVAERFRVRLMGNTLEVSFEASGICSPGSARALAEKYVETLVKHLPVMPLALISEAEFLERTTPPFGNMTTFSVNREDRTRVASAIRETRNELLASGDTALRGCYNYLQDAHESMNTPNDKPAYAAYKAMEVLVKRFGGERKAVAALGKTLKEAKRVANEERHIPKEGQPQPKASVRSVGLAIEVIRKYERYLLEKELNQAPLRQKGR